MSSWRMFLILVVIITLNSMGCAPVQQFFMKEKQKETIAAPRAAIQVDRFSYGRAMGKVDILFVVDNTETGEPAGVVFRNGYIDFVARFRQPEARLLDYRIQVVTHPGNASPGNWTSQSVPPEAQQAELFGAPGGPSSPPLMSYSERGYLNPFQAVTVGLGHKAFEGRSSNPLFLIFILGADVHPNSSPETSANTFAESIKSSRGFYQTSAFFISRLDPGIDSPCSMHVQPATRVLPTLRSMPWRSQAERDICDPTWGTSLAETIFLDLIEFKTKLVLSRTPYQPETMLVRSANHLFRYGDDYHIDLKTHEITFDRDPGLQGGDLLEASYHLIPQEELLSGGQTPFPTRSGG